MTNYTSELRQSDLSELLEKARKLNYGNYLVSMRLERIRQFAGALITFDFPVTALIGPNGGGKTTILNAAACAYQGTTPRKLFPRSKVGDESMENWEVEYELIDRSANPRGSIRSTLCYADNIWRREPLYTRPLHFFTISRTVPVGENPMFQHRRSLSRREDPKGFHEMITISTRPVEGIEHVKREAERVLGKSLANFELMEVTISKPGKIGSGKKKRNKWLEQNNLNGVNEVLPQLVPVSRGKQLIFVGSDRGHRYSEFNFGAGESSVIRIVAEIERLPDQSLVLLEELENGLHPIAVRRLTEYLIAVAKRKKIQVIFTTHSDFALAPLPPEAIWACIDGRLQQGKLSVEVLRAVAGRVDRKLAVFVEDEFARAWVQAILRETIGSNLDEIGVYAVGGDGAAVQIHRGHRRNPAIEFTSICFIDGDSRQLEDEEAGVFRLPGEMPELTVFNNVLENLEQNIALLTVACQRSLDKQEMVEREIRSIAHTNRDPHVLFSQVGVRIGFVPESVVRGAFLSIWIQQNPVLTTRISGWVHEALKNDQKTE